MKIKVPVKILGKRSESGWFRTKFYLVIKPLEILKPVAREFRIDHAAYCDLSVGEEILLTFIDEGNGKVSLYRPY